MTGIDLATCHDIIDVFFSKRNITNDCWPYTPHRYIHPSQPHGHVLMSAEVYCLDARHATTRRLTRTIPTTPTAEGLLPCRLRLPDTPNRTLELGLRTRGLFKASSPDKPLISCVTVALNAVNYIEDTIRSVLSQSYDNIEYIIIDGGSSDGTLEILRHYKYAIDYAVSEPDTGIADSFNKGISLARGEFIGLINADDYYAPEAAALVAGSMADIPWFSYGACIYLKADSSSITIPPALNYRRTINFYMPQIHHPTVFMRRGTYARFGLFDSDLRYAMDYKLLLHLARHNCYGTPLPQVIASMRMQGASNVQYYAVRREVRDIAIHHGTSRPVAWLCYWLLLAKYALQTRKRWQ
ncbi:glycosyltransferase [Desulfovibrionales bacterium]